MMEKKGFAPDLTVFDKIVSGLCKLNRIEEAKRLLNVMVKEVQPQKLRVSLLHLIYEVYGGFLVEGKGCLEDRAMGMSSNISIL